MAKAATSWWCWVVRPSKLLVLLLLPLPTQVNVRELEVPTTTGGAGTATINANAFDKLETIYVRNEGSTALSVSTGVASAVTLNNLTAAQATAITLAHGTTFNSNIVNNLITANLKTATGAADTVGLTIVDGTNNNPIFNAQLAAGKAQPLPRAWRTSR